ncbi:sensor histidine kinase [Paenibacillus roseipurpureus]|uniref:Histidine kinase n=1 Tax=Paenibacillus roseopurpureus TaxID=2918901 RepID=A0AA96LS80_9BACL|nr:histidine kinase [Paenibacillus sp. MBLB1832]WNR46257.1 histidine kinase [Paenibacillus sp. MBLB1832]
MISMRFKLAVARKSVLWRLFFGLVLVSIPFYGLTFLAASKASDVITKEVEMTNQSRLQFYVDFLEQEMQNVKQMMMALNNDVDVPLYYLQQSAAFSHEKYTLYQVIKSKMNIVYYSSNYISDVFLLLPETNKQITFNNGESDLDDRKRGILARHAASVQQTDHYVKQDTVSFSVSFPDQQTEQKVVSYVLGVEISQERILKALSSFRGNSDHQMLLINNQSKLLVGANQVPDSGKKVYEGIQQDPKLKTVTYQRENYMVQSDTSPDGLFTLVSYIPEKKILSPIYMLRYLFWLVFLGSLALFLLLSVLIYNQIHKPLRELVRLMRLVEGGNLQTSDLHVPNHEFGYVHRQYNRMVNQLRTLIQEVLESKIQLQQAQLKQLQSQINPHFLFNCFYIGYRMAKSGETENVAKLCKYLGDYFRFVTHRSMHEVLLVDEVKYASIYLEIQKMRFTYKLDYAISMEDEASLAAVPGLILQPLVENAILHGIEKIDHPGMIEIKVKRLEGCVQVSVEDNGVGMGEEQKRQLRHQLEKSAHEPDHCGLWNVHWRLKHRFKGTEGLELLNRTDGSSGLVVRFTIPVMASEVQHEVS